LDVLAGVLLSFEGEAADYNLIDFYDIAEALVGFERSLAITAHYVVNGEIITQAPSLKNVRIFASPPQNGSWKIPAWITAAAITINQINGIPQTTPIGNLIYSAYDFVVSETLGFHVDFSKTLGIQYEEYRKQHLSSPAITESGIDSVIEKCDMAIRQMHRPVVKSETASLGWISQVSTVPKRIATPISLETYEYLSEFSESDSTIKVRGRISSYNINTYKGRIFDFSARRTIPFVLQESARDRESVLKITRSLASNAMSRAGPVGDVELITYVQSSKTGILKRYLVISVSTVS
jgi:hypothetical protein